MRRDLPFAEIVRRENVTADLMKLWLKPSVPFSFVPGQYCTISFNNIPRPYSICSAPDEEFLELFIKLVPPPEGNLTPLLWELKEGDQVTFYPKAKGVFTREQYQNHFFVCTGTGVAPFVSMVRAYPSVHAGRMNLLYGVRFQNEFGYLDELLQAERISFYSAVSKPELPENATWQGFGGRVTAHIHDILVRQKLFPEDTLVYACGNPDMIEDTKKLLTPYGYRVKEEQYWKPDKKGGAS